MISGAKVRKTNRGTVTVNYPKTELKELRSFCDNYGSKQYILNAAIMGSQTLNRILDTGKAQIKTIEKIRKALAKFKAEAAEQNIA